MHSHEDVVGNVIIVTNIGVIIIGILNAGGGAGELYKGMWPK